MGTFGEHGDVVFILDSCFWCSAGAYPSRVVRNPVGGAYVCAVLDMARMSGWTVFVGY